MDKNANNKIVPINDEVMDNENEEMSLDDMVEMKKMLDRRIKEIMKNKLTFERAHVNHRRKTAKRGESWRIRFRNIVNGDPSSQEREVTLYATNNKADLIAGIDDVIRMLTGLKEQLEKEQEKEGGKKQEVVKEEKAEQKPEQKKDKVTNKQTGKGGNKK